MSFDACRASGATGTTSWGYDDGGRVTQVAGPQGTIAYGYTGTNRRATMTLPGNRTVSYDYDAAGQLASVTDWLERSTAFTHTSFGALDTITRPNDVTTNYDYDAAGRLNVVAHAGTSGLLARFAYGLDGAGNRTSVTITGGSVANGTESYTYDPLDRLIEVAYPNGGGTVQWTYDATGNRLTQTSGAQTTTYAYNAAGELTGTSGAFVTTYTYDDNGNRLSAGADSFQYDWRNRLASATVGGASVAYTYAGDDLRATRVQGSTTTPYLWDREAGLPELVDDGTTVYLQLAGGELASVDAATGAASTRTPSRTTSRPGSASALRSSSASAILTSSATVVLRSVEVRQSLQREPRGSRLRYRPRSD